MVNFVVLKQNIVEVIGTLSGITNVIWQQQNANVPSGDLIALKIESFSRLGYLDDEFYTDTSGDALKKGSREFVLSVRCLSSDCVPILDNLLEKLEFVSTLELLGEKKLVFVNDNYSVTDITDIIGDEYEHQATIDIKFRISNNYFDEVKDSVGYIETVVIDNTVKQENNEFSEKWQVN